MRPAANDAVPAPSRRRADLLSRLRGPILAGTVLGSYAWWGRTTQPSIESRQAIAWATFGAVLAFAACAWRARRWISLPAAVWGAVAFGACHGFTLVRPVRLFYAADVDSRVSLTRERLAELDRQAGDVALWRAGGLPSRSIPYRDSGYDPLFFPGLPNGLPIQGSTFALASYEGPLGSNRRAWEAYGAGLAATLPARHASLEAELASARAGLAAPPRSAADEARLWIAESIGLSVDLLAFNALALLFGRGGARKGTVAAKRQARATGA